MNIAGKEYDFQDVSRVLTVPDCIVLGPNKLGTGNGEAKFYFGPKPELSEFTLGKETMECFFLKTDLLTYMKTAQCEYEHPSQNYAGKDRMAELWQDRIAEISKLPEIVEFTVSVQNQIAGRRGYLNSKDAAYRLFRKLSLPLISYISIMRLTSPRGTPIYYWKLFVDFDAIQQKAAAPQTLVYGRGEARQKPLHKDGNKQYAPKISGRDATAQKEYRRSLLEECPYCPITRISDERLLVASHIKPCAVSAEKEAFDPKNGFVLSPLYDKLFDQGFISFDEKKCMMVSNWLSPSNQERCRIKPGDFIQLLPLDSAREHYMKYHRQFVFKG